MLTRKINLFMISLLLLTACGPETIFVRPRLDTPEQHLTNGRVLLEQGKYQHALQEFSRAHELNPDNLDALIGLGVATGHCTTIDQGEVILQHAEKLATTNEDQKKIQDGYRQLLKARPNPQNGI